MELTLYRDDSGFAALAAEWNALLSRSRFDTIFLTWEWQTTWWRRLGSARGALYLLAARADGRLVGILPLYLTTEGDTRVLNVVGCIEVSDYLDLIIEAGQEETVYAAFLAWLAGDPAATAQTGHAAPAWDELRLCNQPATSLAHTRFPEMAEAGGWHVEAVQEDVCPAIALPASNGDQNGWEVYLAGLDKKERHEIRRKLHRMEREAPNATVRFVRGGVELPQAVESFIELHRLSRPDKHAFMTDEMQAYFRAIATVLAASGWLQLSFLDIAGQPAASYFCFDYRNEVLVYNSGYDPAASPQLSPGWVLLAQLIRNAITKGRSRFDFLQGSEDYKHRFGGLDYPVYRTTIRRT